MDAALLLCIELEKIGQLTENFTIITKELWMKPHFSFEDLKITTVKLNKNKKQYRIKVIFYSLNLKYCQRIWDLTVTEALTLDLIFQERCVYLT